MPDKPKKMPAKIKRLIHACECGQSVCLTLRHSDVGDERSYSLEPSGKPIGQWTVNRALEMGIIVPTGDGLFPDLDSQTYRLAQ